MLTPPPRKRRTVDGFEDGSCPRRSCRLKNAVNWLMLSRRIDIWHSGSTLNEFGETFALHSLISAEMGENFPTIGTSNFVCVLLKVVIAVG